jgi:hypothetical protein
MKKKVKDILHSKFYFKKKIKNYNFWVSILTFGCVRFVVGFADGLGEIEREREWEILGESFQSFFLKNLSNYWFHEDSRSLTKLYEF